MCESRVEQSLVWLPSENRGNPQSVATMRTKVHFLTFDEVFSTLRTLGFDVQGVPGVANQFLVSKYGAGAVLAKAGDPSEAEKKLPHTAVWWRHRPGYLVSGEV